MHNKGKSAIWWHNLSSLLLAPTSVEFYNANCYRKYHTAETIQKASEGSVSKIHTEIQFYSGI